MQGICTFVTFSDPFGNPANIDPLFQVVWNASVAKEDRFLNFSYVNALTGGFTVSGGTCSGEVSALIRATCVVR